MKRALEKKKTFFLVSQMLSFRETKQISKNIADTTFNKGCYGNRKKALLHLS